MAWLSPLTLSHTIPWRWVPIPNVKSLANPRASGLAVILRLEMSLSLLETPHGHLSFGFESFGFASWSGLQAPWGRYCALVPRALAGAQSRCLGSGESSVGWGSQMDSGGSLTPCRGVSVHLSGQREQNFRQILRRGFHLQGSRNLL